jgi:hypothetical protein
MITAATTAFIVGADPTVWSNENSLMSILALYCI